MGAFPKTTKRKLQGHSLVKCRGTVEWNSTRKNQLFDFMYKILSLLYLNNTFSGSLVFLLPSVSHRHSKIMNNFTLIIINGLLLLFGI